MQLIKIPFLVVLLFIFISSVVVYTQTDSLKPDYRNRINLPEYNRTSKQLNKLDSTSEIWTELNPKIPRVDYLGIDFIDTLNGWACGSNGTLIKTTDGGNEWETIKSNVTINLKTIDSFNGQTIITAGDSGAVLISINSGQDWEYIDINTISNFWNIKFINEYIVWLVGEDGGCYKSKDGGRNWEIIHTPLDSLPLWDVSFIDTSCGFICSNGGKVIKTTNGGHSWQLLQVGDNYALYSIVALDSFHIVAGGELVKFVYSSDGGYNWNQTLLSQDLPINEISFLDGSLGYAVGNASEAYRTTDGGINWVSIEKIGEWGLCFVNNTTGYNVGEGLKIFKTYDAGNNWNKIVLNDDFSQISFVSESEGWATAGKLLYYTNDKGITWIVNKKFPYGYPSGILSSLCFLDKLSGFVGTQMNGIYKTSDGGNTWERGKIVNAVDTLGYINDILFINNKIGWAVTSRGGIFKTTDAGENWYTQLNAGLSIIFHNIFFLDSLYGWTANHNSNPYKTTDGGVNWVEQYGMNINASYDIFWANYLNGFLLVFNKLYITTDGGSTWNIEPDLQNIGIARFGYYGDNTIFILGSEKVFRSLNAGYEWIELTSARGMNINCLSLINPGIGYAGGDKGLILKYADSTVDPSGVHDNLDLRIVPSEIFLSQNYPNPFNPTTKIMFRSEETGLVSLTLYNLLGEEIEKLFVGNIAANQNYEVTFNASNCTSGVYFYELKQNNNTITKKMILNK